MINKRNKYAGISFGVAVAVLATAIFGFQPKTAQALTNVATSGTGYRWYGLSASTDDTNKTAATGVNDGNTSTDFSLTTSGADDSVLAYEAAGVIWGSNQSIVSAKFKNGTYDGNNNGVFADNFKLQYTTNGSTWFDTNWTYSPSYQYDSSDASGVEFTFSGSELSARGIRVVGQVRLYGGNSWFANARELQAFADETAPTPTATPSGQTNLALVSNGATGYRWYGMTSSTADTNKTAATGVNDDDQANLVSLNAETDDGSNKWEAAGVIWSSNKTVNKISFVQGQYTDDKNGPFGANLKAQYTTDGSTWADSGWSISPSYAYDNQSEQYKTFEFSGSNTSVKGVRVVGQVHISSTDGSWFARVNEVLAIGSGTAPATATAFPTNTPVATNTPTTLPNTPTATPRPTNTPLPTSVSSEATSMAVHFSARATQEAGQFATPAPGKYATYTDPIYTPTLPIHYTPDGYAEIVVWPLIFHDPNSGYANSAGTTYTDAVAFANRTLVDMNEAFKDSGIKYVFGLGYPQVVHSGFPQLATGKGDARLYNYLPDCYEMKHYWGGVRQIWLFTDTDAHLHEVMVNGPNFKWLEDQHNITNCGFQQTYFGFTFAEKNSISAWQPARRENTLHDMAHYAEWLFDFVAPQVPAFLPVSCDTVQYADASHNYWPSVPRVNSSNVQNPGSLEAYPYAKCANISRPLTITGPFMGRAYSTTLPSTGITNSQFLTNSVMSNCGDTHNPPNIVWFNDSKAQPGHPSYYLNEYWYDNNQTKILSGCYGFNRHWNAHPDIAYTEIDCTAWTCDASGVTYFKWWFQQMPGIGPHAWDDRYGTSWEFNTWFRLWFI